MKVTNSIISKSIFNQDFVIFPNSNSNNSQADIPSQRSVPFHFQVPFSQFARSPTYCVPSCSLQTVIAEVSGCFSTQRLQILIEAPAISETMMWDDNSPSKIVHGSANSIAPLNAGNLFSSTISLSALAKIFISKDARYTPYLILCCSSIVMTVILVLLLTCYCIVRRLRSGQYGNSLKYLYLRNATNLEFVTAFDEKQVTTVNLFNGYSQLNNSCRMGKSRQCHTRSNLSPQFTFLKKTILVSFLSFRVFYTFIFTFSVALSMLLSLWPPEAQNPGIYGLSLEINENLLPPRQKEAFQREVKTENELNLQSRKASQRIHGCQQLMVTEIVDVTRELDRVVGQVLNKELLQTNNSMNMFHAMEDFVNQHTKEYHIAINDYISQLKAILDHTMMPDVVKFSELLSKVYASYWLHFVRRMLNSTSALFSDSRPMWSDRDSSWSLGYAQDSVLEPMHLNISKIQFARQFGLIEADTFLLMPSRIMKE